MYKDIFGKEYHEAVVNRDTANAVVSTAPDIKNWIEAQVAKGHCPTIEEINRKVPSILRGYEVREIVSMVFFAAVACAQAEYAETRGTTGTGKSTTTASGLVAEYEAEAAAAEETEIGASARARPGNLGRGRTFRVKEGSLGTGGNEAKLGGAYKDIPANGGQVHHMPAKSVSPLSKDEGPGIRMETNDHMDTRSWGRSKEAQEYRAKQKKLIDKGKFKEAQQHGY